MPIKIKHAFEREYGKKQGDKIFYAWETKNKLFDKKKLKGGKK